MSPLVCYRRRLSIVGDPVELATALFAALGAEDGSALFAPDDGPALLVLTPLLRITGAGRRVRVLACAPGSEALLVPLARALGSHGRVRRRTGTLLFLPHATHADRDEDARLLQPSPLAVLRAAVLDPAVLGPEAAEDRCALGAFGYDLIDSAERLPRAPGAPGVALDLLVPELALELGAQGSASVSLRLARDADAATRARALGRLAAMAAAIEGFRIAPLPPARAGEVAMDLDDAEFAALVARLQAHVRAGDVFQVVPSRTFSTPCPDPRAALRRLVALNPSRYAFALATPERTLFGCSPETAVAVTVDGASRRVRLTPLAGTRPRLRDAAGRHDAESDARLLAELHQDAKELAEHLMLVDLARNDVARISRTGTRRVTELLRTVRGSHVMHLGSEVDGELRPELDALHAYRACMNMGTLCGAPKLRAMELLREHERTPRGCWGGGFGVLRGDGSLDTAIVIRAAEVVDGVAQVRAGAGVVLGSDPAREADETRRKAAAVLRALGVAEAA